MAKSRRRAREAALRALYEIEIGKTRTGDTVVEMRTNTDLNEELMRFAQELVEGVTAKQAFIDDVLAARVQEYDFDRVAAVDRNLLRIATYELYFCPSIPPAVTINEAIELAKKYSTAESGRFVNGVLGRVLLDSPKVDEESATAVTEEEEAPPPEPLPTEESIGEEEAKELSRIGKWQVRSGNEN